MGMWWRFGMRCCPDGAGDVGLVKVWLEADFCWWDTNKRHWLDLFVKKPKGLGRGI